MATIAISALIFLVVSLHHSDARCFGCGRRNPMREKKDVCLVYNDPYVRRYHSRVTEKLDLTPGYHRLLENNFCPHASYCIYALIGTPYSPHSYHSSVAVIVEFGGRTFWLTRDMQIFDSHGPPPALPTTMQAGGTTVTITSYQDRFLRLVTAFGLEVRMYRQNGWGKIHVYATAELQICGKGLCKVQAIGQTGISMRGKRSVDPAQVSSGKQAELAAIARKFNIGQKKEEMSAVVPRSVMLKLLPEAKERLAFVLDKKGPFKKCHKVKDWDPQDQYKVAYETAAEMGMDNDALEMAITAIAENCEAISGGKAKVDVKSALRKAADEDQRG